MPNLKRDLMQLGNNLVADHGFNPSGYAIPEHNIYHAEPSTQPITDFTEWLNNCPEAREELEKAGYEWPVVPKAIIPKSAPKEK